MLRTERIAKRQRLCDQTLAELQSRCSVSIEALLPEQRWVVFAALQVLVVLEPVPPLRRLVGYFLLHCGLSLPAPVVGAVLALGPRAVSSLKHTGAAQLLAALRPPASGSLPKLRGEHVGSVVRFLLDHPGSTLPQLQQFVRSQLGLSVQRHALRRFLRRYGLASLRTQRVDSGPLFTDTPATPAPSSCSARPSAWSV